MTEGLFYASTRYVSMYYELRTTYYLLYRVDADQLLDNEYKALAQKRDGNGDHCPKQDLVGCADLFLVAAGGQVLKGGPKDKDNRENKQDGEEPVDDRVDDVEKIAEFKPLGRDRDHLVNAAAADFRKRRKWGKSRKTQEQFR